MQAMLTGGLMILIWGETACSMEKKLLLIYCDIFAFRQRTTLIFWAYIYSLFFFLDDTCNNLVLKDIIAVLELLYNKVIQGNQ